VSFRYIRKNYTKHAVKNVKDILIPSEEMKIQVYPMDYEEFCEATNNNYSIKESFIISLLSFS
jgi:hypothetical protein